MKELMVFIPMTHPLIKTRDDTGDMKADFYFLLKSVYLLTLGKIN